MQMPDNANVSSPLGALIMHFNASSKSVKKSFSKLFAEYTAKEEEEQDLSAKIERGMRDIRSGKGISKMEGETTEEFFERLCTM